jgi:hypothetical protein
MEPSVRDKTEATRLFSWQRLKSTVISSPFHLPAKQKNTKLKRKTFNQGTDGTRPRVLEQNMNVPLLKP